MRTRKAARIAAAGVVLLAAAGAISERIGARRDRERLPQVGRSVDIGGRTMNIFCSGEGAPAVIFDAGGRQPGISWSHIQPQIAALTRACWFDRAGMGWSDAGPFPRDSRAMSHELHELLLRAGVAPPYVLVGHSLGGLNARVYNGIYPDQVAGVVLVDAAHEDEPSRAPASMRGYSAPRWLWRPVWTAGQTARAVGLLRLATPRIDLPPDPRARSREQVVEALSAQPKTRATLFDASMSDSYAQAGRSAGFGDKPLIVLTRGRLPVIDANSPQEVRELEAYEKVWMHAIQPKLAKLSTRGRQVLVLNSGHSIPDEAPWAVVSAVRDVVGEVRGFVGETSASIYALLLETRLHGIPAARMAVGSVTVPMRPLLTRNREWLSQFGAMPRELEALAGADDLPGPRPLGANAVSPGTRVIDSAEVDAIFASHGIHDNWDAFYTRFDVAGWIAVSDILYTVDLRDALFYYRSGCGGLCGEGGYVWAHRDSATSKWRLARKVITEMS
jgi:pimeloyl-ACP methyl ester carboxylesterase